MPTRRRGAGAISDARELTFGGLLPTGSLLEWIDDMYEGPKTMIDRTLGLWRNLRTALHIFPPDVRKQMVFKVFGFKENPSGGKLCVNGYIPADLQTHGSFNGTDKCYWQETFWR